MVKKTSNFEKWWAKWRYHHQWHFWPYRKGYSIKEWFLLNLGKCPACVAGIWPHRNCILR